MRVGANTTSTITRARATGRTALNCREWRRGGDHHIVYDISIDCREHLAFATSADAGVGCGGCVEKRRERAVLTGH